jgi:hypothetical protein
MSNEPTDHIAEIVKRQQQRAKQEHDAYKRVVDERLEYDRFRDAGDNVNHYGSEYHLALVNAGWGHAMPSADAIRQLATQWVDAMLRYRTMLRYRWPCALEQLQHLPAGAIEELARHYRKDPEYVRDALIVATGIFLARGREAVAKLVQLAVGDPPTDEDEQRGIPPVAPDAGFAAVVAEMLRSGIRAAAYWQECVPMTDTNADPRNDVAPRKEMTQKEVAKRLNQLRLQGEPWTSYEKMRRQIGAGSTLTLYRAVKDNDVLRHWAKQRQAAPRAQQQGLTGPVLDNANEQREPDPEDDTADIELRAKFENAEPEERAFLNTVKDGPRDYLLWYIHKPDKERRKHRKAWNERIGIDPTMKAWFETADLGAILEYLSDPDWYGPNQSPRAFPRV